MELMLLDLNLGAELLGHRVSVYLALEDTTTLLQNGFAVIHSASTIYMRVTVALHPGPYLLVLDFLFYPVLVGV